MAERIGAQVLPTTRQQQEQLVVHLISALPPISGHSEARLVPGERRRHSRRLAEFRFIPESGRCAVQPEISALGQKRNQLACDRRARAAPFNQKL
jgi:hypothetical protein